MGDDIIKEVERHVLEEAKPSLHSPPEFARGAAPGLVTYRPKD